MSPATRAAIAFEMRKTASGVVTRLVSVLTLVLVVATTVGGYAAAIHAADTDTGRKAAEMVGEPGWAGFTGLAATSIGVTTLLAAGIVMAWAAGREFAEGTVVGLFALPVSRGGTALAKMLAVVVWVVLLAVAAGALVAGLGTLALGLPLAGAGRCAAVLAAVASLLGVSALPVMWVATVGRGYLAGVGAALGLVVVSNLAAGFGLGGLVPWAVPVLWALPGSGVGAASLLLPASAAVGGAVLTWLAWSRLQLGDG